MLRTVTGAGIRSLSSKPMQNPVPASFIRGGTSKGIYLQRSHLPEKQSEWNPIFLGIMGSPDPDYGRQLDGMGGGISSLSKICVVAPPTPEQKAIGIDVEYTFVQVGIRDSVIDLNGNCGNLSSMIGVFGIDQGICTPSKVVDGHATVRSYNTNTDKLIDTTFPISESGVPVLDLPQASIAGVPGRASQIVLDFVNPSGARTGKLLPSGAPVNTLEVRSVGTSVKASLVDATNPTVFILHDELAEFLPIDDYVRGIKSAEKQVSKVLEEIRQAGAVVMGLDPAAQSQPKIAFLRQPTEKESSEADIVIHALSMGTLHKAVPMTVGLCLGAAAKTKGTIAWDIVQKSKAAGELIRILHPGGVVEVGAEYGSGGSITSAKVVRTGRRLMEGSVYW